MPTGMCMKCKIIACLSIWVMGPAVCLQTDVQSGAPGGIVREKSCPCVDSLKSQKVVAAYWS